MELFLLTQEGDVELNKIWINTNPILRRIIERDKGKKNNSNDSDARKKLKAKRDFKLMYLLINPESEYSEYPAEQRLAESINLLGYSMKELEEDEELQDALREYQRIFESIPSVRAYKAARKSYDSKVHYIDNIDFYSTDKTGKPLVSASEHSKIIKLLKEDVVAIRELEETMVNDITVARLTFRKTASFSEEDEEKMIGVNNHKEGLKFGK